MVTTTLGLIVITHGKLCEAFVDSLNQITGKNHDIHCISLSQGDDHPEKQREIDKAVISANQGKGVIILTDLFGGTPSNLAITALQTGEVEVIAGINLPMLLQLVSLPPNLSLQAAVSLAQDAGRRQIQVPSAFLGFSHPGSTAEDEFELPAV